MSTNGPTLMQTTSLAIVLAIVAVGCNQNPYLAGTAIGGPGSVPGIGSVPGNGSVPGTGAAWGTPNNTTVAAGEARLAELSRRVQLLDDNNRQLHIQLAQSEQQARVHQEEADLLRQQLGDVNSSMRQSATAARQSGVGFPADNPGAMPDSSNVQGFRASATLPPRPGDQRFNDQRFSDQAAGRPTTTMRANTNMTQAAGRLNLNFPIETEGDVIRIIVPSDQLFSPATAQFHSQAATMLDPVASQLRTLFPSNRIGIEGYTDSGSSAGSGSRGINASAHQLTSAQADAVLGFFSSRGGLAPSQLFTVAQGENNPRANNVTPAGRAANRRIEIVVYP